MKFRMSSSLNKPHKSPEPTYNYYETCRIIRVSNGRIWLFTSLNYPKSKIWYLSNQFDAVTIWGYALTWIFQDGHRCPTNIDHISYLMYSICSISILVLNIDLIALGIMVCFSTWFDSNKYRYVHLYSNMDSIF